jgi:N6-L-threonylcarbamoyladenine synthase
MILLSIETSCDETAVSVVKSFRGKKIRFEVLSHKILSQIDLHREYGGVFPALAKREHAKAITQLIAEALEEAELLVERTNLYHLPHADKHKLGLLLEREPEMVKAMTVLFEGVQKPKIDAIAVTSGPGLEPALWVGINAALALHQVWDVPVYPINHMEGHIITGLLSKDGDMYEIADMSYPSVALLVSGGHTELVRIPTWRKYQVIGKTKDDAVGEAFDKVARLLGLPYPGGPEISRLAKRARDRQAVVPESFRLPRPMIHSGDLLLSFSGLKTAVMTRVKKHEQLNEEQKELLALEFENAVTDVLVAKTKQALYETSATSLIVGGGVSANTHIKKALENLTREENVTLYYPDTKLSGDNGLMIAATGLCHIEKNILPKVKIVANGSWSIENT